MEQLLLFFRLDMIRKHRKAAQRKTMNPEQVPPFVSIESKHKMPQQAYNLVGRARRIFRAL